MQYSLNLRAMAAEAFGLTPLLRFQLPTDNALQKKEQEYQKGHANDLYGTPYPPNDEGKGVLGLPMFQRVLLGPVGREVVLQEPILTIDRDHLIVTTEIQGRDGTVKEYIGKGDYAISLKGILAPPLTDGRYARRYPEQQVQALRRVVDLGETIPIACRLCAQFGIYNVVVKSVSWPPLPGFTNLQAYELRLLSDDPPELLV